MIDLKIKQNVNPTHGAFPAGPLAGCPAQGLMLNNQKKEMKETITPEGSNRLIGFGIGAAPWESDHISK